MLRKFLDIQIPFFIPMWRRVVFTGGVLLWALIELVSGQPFWAVMFGAAGLYMAHQFFVAWDPKDPDGEG